MENKRTSNEILTELDKCGELKTLVKDGHLSPCIIRNLDVWRYVDVRLKTGSKVKQAVLEAEIDFSICRRTVFRILKTFK